MSPTERAPLFLFSRRGRVTGLLGGGVARPKPCRTTLTLARAVAIERSRKRHRFFTRKVRQTFHGYAIAQLKKIKTHRAWPLLLLPLPRSDTKGASGAAHQSSRSALAGVRGSAGTPARSHSSTAARLVRARSSAVSRQPGAGASAIVLLLASTARVSFGLTRAARLCVVNSTATSRVRAATFAYVPGCAPITHCPSSSSVPAPHCGMHWWSLSTVPSPHVAPLFVSPWSLPQATTVNPRIPTRHTRDHEEDMARNLPARLRNCNPIG